MLCWVFFTQRNRRKVRNANKKVRNTRN